MAYIVKSHLTTGSGQIHNVFNSYETQTDKYHGKLLDNLGRKFKTFGDRFNICSLS